MFVTGLADVITWQKSRHVGLVKYRWSDASLYPFRFNSFLKNFNSPSTSKFLDNNQYNEAVKLFGKLKYDECFDYTPLLVLGGSEKPENLQKMKIIQHIDIIIQASGRIE